MFGALNDMDTEQQDEDPSKLLKKAFESLAKSQRRKEGFKWGRKINNHFASSRPCVRFHRLFQQPA